jgi:hypothetical protein
VLSVSLGHVSADGALHWSAIVGGSQNTHANDLTSYGDSALIAVGDAWAGDKTSARVLRPDVWGNSTCSSSAPCAAKTLADCADTNPCTADLCDAAHNGRYHTNLPDGSPCGGGKICKAGACQ